MKVHYGTSIPPGLDAPTRGELKVRIERLALQDELMPKVEGAPLVPVDHCAVSIVFWGDEKSSGSLVCVPATDAHVERGVQCCLFPVKTLEAQLVQYLQHMGASANRGLQLRVSVPPHHSGKRAHIPVGLAIVDLGGVTATTPLHGWFQVVHHNDEAHCIGRIKVSVALNMFASTASTSGGDAADSTKQAKVPGGGAAATHRAAALPTNASTSLGGDQDAAPRADEQRSDEHRPTASPTATPPPPSATTTAVEGPRVAAPTLHQDNSAPIITATSALGSDANLRSWFERGMALRSKMTSAATGASIDSYTTHHSSTGGRAVIGPAASQIAMGITGAFHSGHEAVGSLPQRIPMLSGAEHLHEAGLNDSALSDGVVSSSDSEDSDRSSVTNARDGWGCTHQRTRPSVSIPFEGTLRVSIAHIGFSATDAATTGWNQQQQPCEIRFAMRLSSDVLSHDPRKGTTVFSSFVHVLPFSADAHRRIALAAGGIRGYTSCSKLVLECIQVVSKPAPPRDPHPVGRWPGPDGVDGSKALAPGSGGAEQSEARPLRFLVEDMLQQRDAKADAGQRVLVSERIVGVCVMDLCAQTKRCTFLDPLSGQSLVVCDVQVDLVTDPLTAQEQAEADRLSQPAPQFMAQDYKGEDGGHTAATKHHQGHITHQRKAVVAMRSSSSDSCNDVSRSGDDASSSGDAGSDAGSRTTRTSSSSAGSRGSSCGSGGSTTRRRRHRHSDGHRRRRHATSTPNNNTSSPQVVVYQHDGRGGGIPYDTTVTVHQRAAAAGRNTVPASLASAVLAHPLGAGQEGPRGNNTRHRFHVAIQEAKDLPSVCCVEGNSVSSMLSVSHEAEDAGSTRSCDGAQHRPPTTFVALDELYAPRRSGHNHSTTSSLSVSDHHCGSQSMLLEPSAVLGSWYVEAAVQGTGARSSPPVAQTAAPKFHYEGIVSIAVDGPNVAPSAAGNHSITHTLGFVDVGLYHVHNGSDDDGVGTTMAVHPNNKGGRQPPQQDEAAVAAHELQQEREVWQRARLIGTARVDVSPLRYLPVMDGWHRVVSANHAVETCVGFVRVSIRPL